MKIAITLVHNKIPQENEAQIEFLKPLIVKNTFPIPIYDQEGNKVGQDEGYYYSIKDLDVPHEASFFQIVPFGVTPPPNLYHIDSHKVFYAKGDEDKTGDHPRFFNWGLKRGTDYGADISIYLDDPKKMNLKDLPFYLNSLIDPDDKTEFAEDQFGKMGTLRLLKEVGQLKEDRTLADALTDLKSRNTKRGGKNG